MKQRRILVIMHDLFSFMEAKVRNASVSDTRRYNVVVIYMSYTYTTVLRNHLALSPCPQIREISIS